MNRSNRIQSLIWGLLGLYLVYEGMQLKLGSPRAPKPGFMIFWMGVVILILGGAFFLQSLSTPAVGKKIRWKEVPWQRGIKVMAALFLYVAVFHWLGFILSTFLLLLFLFKGLEPQKWWTAILISTLTVGICYLVFGVFLELQFPPGVLKDVL